MRTRIANKILKENSRKMTKLTSQFSKMARELRSIRLNDPLCREKARTIIKNSEANRAEWNRLQAEITALVGLEMYLPKYKPKES